MAQSHRSVRDLKSVSDIKAKAGRYSSSDETKKLVKQAILQELNSHLISIKPQIIHKKTDDQSRRTKKVPKSLRIDKRERNNSDKKPMQMEPRFVVERHVPQPISRIPRPISDVTNLTYMKNASPKPAFTAIKIPGYDWDKNGRISELRIRYIARKYLGLWSNRVFGRISPSHARRHYHKKLMKDAFQVLEDLWWNSRKGWKLNIRAEYHNRYRVWKKTIKAWKLFVVYSKQKAVKRKIAEKFDEMSSTRNAFSSWQLYCKLRRQKKERREKADELRNSFLYRSTFQLWLKNTSSSQINKFRETEALSFWAYSVKLRTFKNWVRAKKIRKKENEKTELANIHFGRYITKKCLDAFLSNVEDQRSKQNIKDFAVNHFQQTLKQRSIKIWYLQLQHRLEIKELEERINFMARKFTIRNCFVQWKLYIEDLRMLQEKMDVATRHQNRQLKVKYMKALKNAAKRRCLKIERKEKADSFRQNKVLLVHWNRWLHRCDNSEELKLYPLTKIARAFFRKKLLKESLVQWWYYIRWRRERKIMYNKADEHFKNAALPKYLLKLHDYAEVRKFKTERKHAADDFSRELRCARVFYTWLIKYRLEQDLRMLERMAILQNEEVCKRRTLSKWRKMTKNLLSEKDNEEKADACLEYTLKKLYFSLLKINLTDEKTRRMHEVIAVRHGNKKLLLMVWISWKKFTKIQASKHRKLAFADNHYNKVVLAKTIKIFKIYIQQRRDMKKEVQRRERLHSMISMRWTFCRWHENVKELVKERENIKIAEEFLNFKTEKKVFSCWREISILTSHNNQMKKLRLAGIIQDLNIGKLRRAFNSMKTYATISKRKKYLNTVAVQFNEKKVKIHFMKRWRCFVGLSFRKLLLQRQSMVFYTKRCMKSVFQHWKTELEKSLEERNKTNVVMWWWSQNLQRKALYAWLDFVLVSKQNKKRIAEALELRRDWMLENCIKKWFEYSSDMIAFRTKIAQARQIEGSVRLQEKVRKYALLWYNKSKKSKRTNLPSSEARLSGVKHPPLVQDSLLNIGLPEIMGRSNGILEIPTINESRRLIPRKPDYLKDSFDLNLLLETTDTETNLLQPKQSDESQPRVPAPQPQLQTRLQKHPLDRSKENASIDFPASSEDDAKASESKGSQLKRHHAARRVRDHGVVLMPPSSFEKANCDASKVTQMRPENSNHIQNIPENLPEEESTTSKIPCKIDATQGCKKVSLISMPSSDEENFDDSDEESSVSSSTDIGSDDEDAQVESDHKTSLFVKISAIKDHLKQYQDQQNKLRDLEARYLHLSNFLDGEQKRCGLDEVVAQNSDYQQALMLSNEIKHEMDELVVELEKKRPIVTKMARSIKDLTQELYQT